MSKQEGIFILNIYRERLKAQYQSPGWNKWVIYAALASLVWLALISLQNNQLEFNTSIKLLIFSYSFTFVLKVLSKKEVDTKSKYIQLNKEFSPLVSDLFFHFLISIAIIQYSHRFILFDLTILKYMHFVFYGFISLFYCLGILISFLPLHFPTNSKSQTTKIIKNVLNFIFLIFPLGSAYILFNSISDWENIIGWKTFCIFFAFFFLIDKLIYVSRKNPLINQIDSLIDDITFDRIEVSQYTNSLRLIIVGLEFKDAISVELFNYLETVKKTEEKFSLIHKKIDQLKLAENSDLKESIKDSISVNFENLKKIIKEYVDQAIKINKRIALYKQFEIDNPNYNEVVEQLSSAQQVIQNRINELEDSLKDIRLI